MAYGFNDDKSIFNIDAALLQAKREAVASARDLEVVMLGDVATLRAWARSLGKGVYNAICYASSSVAVGLPNVTVLLTVYNDGSNITYINAKCISSSSIFYELVYDMFFNGSSWTSWRRDFDDILPGDVVSFDINIGWAGRALSKKDLRVLVPLGRRIRANKVTASGNVVVVCGGVSQAILLNYRPVSGVEDMYYNITSAGVNKNANTVTVRVTFDYNTDLLVLNQLLWFQNDTSVTNKFKLTFS